MSKDDREEFQRYRREKATQMGADEDLQERALEVTIRSDRYDYSYMWDWLGLPIIQMPTDIVVMQEIIWRTQPQLIIETGIARGGSTILHCSMLELIGEGEVLAIDVDIRDHNRRAIESHPLSGRLTMIEGSSLDPAVANAVRSRATDIERVMVILDSDHTHEHVLRELRTYAPLVTVGQYLVVADTFIEQIPVQEHRPRAWEPGANPSTAVETYLREDDRFEIDESIDDRLLLTSNPGGYLRAARP